jgi:hypothetical protein
VTGVRKYFEVTLAGRGSSEPWLSLTCDFEKIVADKLRLLADHGAIAARLPKMAGAGLLMRTAATETLYRRI